MPNNIIKIVITGAESTGKSVLSKVLAKHYDALLVPELARVYIENLGRHYSYDDIALIARMQIEQEQNIPNKTKLVFFDTWLIITKVWFEFVYGNSPDWLHEYILKSSISLFLLCDIDIPWISDPVRENGGETRKILQDIYKNELVKYGFNYQIVSGIGPVRTQNAINLINNLLKSEEKR
jgi:nicotinamide riboside kinase